MNIIGIIPARGGSKRLKNKNILPIMGKPLINWTIDAALNSKYISHNNLYVSTESDDIMTVVGDKCKIVRRPIELSNDDVWMQVPITHAIEHIGVDLDDEDIIVILQANSPQMTSDTIDECIERLLYNDAIWELSTMDNDYINNSHIHVIRKKVCYHIGKSNYNTLYVVDWIDIHDETEFEYVKLLLEGNYNYD